MVLNLLRNSSCTRKQTLSKSAVYKAKYVLVHYNTALSKAGNETAPSLLFSHYEYRMSLKVLTKKTKLGGRNGHFETVMDVIESFRDILPAKPSFCLLDFDALKKDSAWIE